MAEDPKPAVGFVPLKAVTGAKPDPAAALAEIRQIYFKTSSRTIENDFAHAIELLKGLPDEELRAKAHVYMEGLAEMRREWVTVKGQKAKGNGQRAKGKGQKSKAKGPRRR